MENTNNQSLLDLANKLRIHSIQMTNASNSGHPTSCCSMAELISVLFFDQSGMRVNIKHPKSFVNDRFVLSKGHAAPILYAAWAEAGLIKKEELLNIRKFGNDLEGHPTPVLPFVDVATGSLGQGLGCAAGMAYSSKHLDKIDNRIWVLLGDGECAEGSVWEAAHFSQLYGLDNLTAIADINRLGQSEATSIKHDVEVYRKRFEAFGWHAIVIDGHCVESIRKAFLEAKNYKGKPSVVIAKTFKGKGIINIEDKLDWHGKPLGNQAKEAIEIIQKQIQDQNIQLKCIPSQHQEIVLKQEPLKLGNLTYKKGQQIATRNAYGEALKRLGQNDSLGRIVSLDGDTKNSTFAITFKNAFPERFVECFIAEQNMVSVATGLGCRNKVPFVSAFAAFLSRAYDQIRMAGVSKANLKLCGSHSGVSIGEDGASQMALEDISAFRAIAGSCVLYPSDAVSTEKAVELAANHYGVVYIRTSRPLTEIIYDNDEIFEFGKSKIVAKSEKDKILVIGACVTLYEALKAKTELEKKGIHIRIMDIFSIKPIDQEGIIKNAKEAGNQILTVEDHYAEGGIRDAVASAVCLENIKVHSIAVNEVPRSGTPTQLLDYYKLTAQHIMQKVINIVG